MKRLPLSFLTLLAAFLTGIIVVAVLVFTPSKSQSVKSEPRAVIFAGSPMIVNVQAQTNEPKKEDDSLDQFDKIWKDKAEFRYGRYLMTKKCFEREGFEENCEILVKKKNKIYARVKGPTNYWLDYGMFNFLGHHDRQLVIHTYSGGTHGCDDYLIADLNTEFRIIYDSRDGNHCNAIGEELIPADIDRDGLFEFERKSTVHENLGADAACCVTLYVPVIFAYEPKRRRYEIANLKFPAYLSKRASALYKDDGNGVFDRRVAVRLTFLSMVDAGKRAEAWKYFESNCSFDDKAEYRRLVKNEFAHDPVYRTIYGR